ncbi:hypothetical protein Bca4012_018613 [Brassica carinata]
MKKLTKALGFPVVNLQRMDLHTLCRRQELHIKIDAAWDSSSNRAGIAWIVTGDQSFQSTSGTASLDFVASPLVAEALALRLGIITAATQGFDNIIFLSDCLTHARAINCKQQIKEIFGILKDIEHLSSGFASIRFSHISRSQNRDADFLAKQALRVFPFSSVIAPIFVVG